MTWNTNAPLWLIWRKKLREWSHLWEKEQEQEEQEEQDEQEVQEVKNTEEEQDEQLTQNNYYEANPAEKLQVLF